MKGTCHPGVVPNTRKPSTGEAGAGEGLQFEGRPSLKQREMSLPAQAVGTPPIVNYSFCQVRFQKDDLKQYDASWWSL